MLREGACAGAAGGARCGSVDTEENLVIYVSGGTCGKCSGGSAA